MSASVFVIIHNDIGQICFLLRKHSTIMDGHYSLPAGKLEVNETLAECATREAFEEVGIAAKPAELRLVHTVHVKSDQETWLGFYFRCDKYEGKPVLKELEKHTHLVWAYAHEMPKPTVPYVEQAIKMLAENATYSEHNW